MVMTGLPSPEARVNTTDGVARAKSCTVFTPCWSSCFWVVAVIDRATLFTVEV